MIACPVLRGYAEIACTFFHVRTVLAGNNELARRLEQPETKINKKRAQ